MNAKERTEIQTYLKSVFPKLSWNDQSFRIFLDDMGERPIASILRGIDRCRAEFPRDDPAPGKVRESVTKASALAESDTAATDASRRAEADRAHERVIKNEKHASATKMVPHMRQMGREECERRVEVLWGLMSNAQRDFVRKVTYAELTDPTSNAARVRAWREWVFDECITSAKPVPGGAVTIATHPSGLVEMFNPDGRLRLIVERRTEADTTYEETQALERGRGVRIGTWDFERRVAVQGPDDYGVDWAAERMAAGGAA